MLFLRTKYQNMSNITFTMLKPDSIRNGNTGAILDKIVKSGFKIKAMKFTKMTNEKASKFYAIHSERPFFKDLVGYMTSGPIVAAILEKDNAVNDFRELIGSTNPEEAKEGTIRNMFAKSISENAIHGSDSDENAKIECEFHFSPEEIF